MTAKGKTRRANDRILVRATVGLAGLPVGRYAWVDPSDGWIADAIMCGWLVAEPDVPPRKAADFPT